MTNFEHYNPTRIIFGKEQLTKLPQQIAQHSSGKKIMIAYGGGSIVKTGLLDKIKIELAGYELIEFGGIEANPQFTTLMKGVELGREKQIDFILAVGGGSVIDGVKFMTGAYFYQGDAWDVLDRKEGCVFDRALPFGTVLTLPATGSEANSGAVISRDELKEKRTMGGPLFFPRFSFCDPSVVATLPERQIANGIIDAYMHTLEQYLTFSVGNLLQERQAEGILSTLIEIAPKIIQDPSDYTSAANLMWCATHALNGNLRCGVPTDWCTHMIGHELTALYGIDHARTLAIVAPRLLENQFVNKFDMLVQYGKRVWNIEGSDESIAREAIQKTESFFQSLNVQTKISHYSSDTDHIASIIKQRFVERGWTTMGERSAITPEDIESIVINAI
jgi:NADP-dependent alcohol dehydrogenase